MLYSNEKILFALPPPVKKKIYNFKKYLDDFIQNWRFFPLKYFKIIKF